ncbi:MAG: patatin-like phospholipase family protein [Pseudomonadota bacterium]|nr:patatin-like phospholipase family protein [Pseudomonadota bacterium]
MSINPLDLIQALGPSAREALERQTEKLSLPAGHTLFRQGAAADSLYLVVSGSLGVYVTGPGGEKQLIALIEAGETVGEMAVLSDTRRSATVTAIRDSELLRLTKARFDLLHKQEPELMAGINRILVHRLRQVSRGVGRRIEPKTAALLPVVQELPVKPIAERLAALLTAQGSKVCVIGREAAGKSAGWFAELEATHDHVLLCGEMASPDESWIRLCARQADRMLVVAKARDPVMTGLPQGMLQQRADHQLLDLVLLHDKPGLRPSKTQAWLDLLPVNRHFHVREHLQEDWDRLARIIGGRALGVVLSGGGARAYAHIGALQAIYESGLKVDFVGGVSMGGIVGAGLASGWTLDELHARVQDAFVASNPLSDLTLPLISLVRGRKVERLLRTYFGEARITDMWLPYYCVSANLSDATVFVHRTDKIRHALRASIALPGVLPPKVMHQSVLVDGAVINNLPVDVMRGLHRGPIIAVDVARDRALTPEMVQLTRHGNWLDRMRRPPIVSILMRSGTVSGESEIQRQARIADLVIQPPLGDIDIRDWLAFDQAVMIGYEHAAALLSEHAAALARPRRGTTA